MPYLIFLMVAVVLCTPVYLIGRAIIVSGFLKTATNARQINKFDEAIVNYNSAMQWSTGNEEAFSGRWAMAFQTNNLEAAIADYTAVIEQHGNAYLPYCYRGQAYRRLGLNDQARADYEACLAREPDPAWQRSARTIIANIDKGK